MRDILVGVSGASGMPLAVMGRGSGDGGCRRDPAEKGQDEIPNTLSDELLNSVKPLACHAPGAGAGALSCDHAYGADTNSAAPTARLKCLRFM